MKNELNIQKAMFFLTLISSIFICISSNSFLVMWMSMEINLFSFIPIISLNQKMFSEKSSMMYFLIQAISSSIALLTFSMNLENKNLMNFILILSMFMKLGMYPFHFWFISTIEGMNWSTSLIFLTIQKIIPISVIMLIYKQNTMIFFCILNSIAMALSGISILSMRKIMAFSSINHLGIMLIAMTLSKKIFKMYFIIYSMMSYSMTKFMEKEKMNFLFQSFTSSKMNMMNNLTMMILFFSMAGVPPFLGFMPKMMTILSMLKSSMIISTSIILIMNTLSTYFYMRLTLNNIVINSNKYKTKKSLTSMKLPFYLIMSPIFIMML